MKYPLLVLAMIAVFCLGLLGVAGADEGKYRCGNVNLSEDGMITLSDIARLIDRVYISKTPLEIEELGNVNGSQDGLITLSDITYLISYAYLNGPEPNCACCLDRVIPAECLPVVPGTEADGGDFWVEVIGNNIHLHHSADYQCCLYYDVEFEFADNNITAREFDRGEACDCICPFELESVLQFVDPGEYFVTLIGIYGDTIGTQVAVISGNSLPITWEHGPCEENPGGSLSLSENITYAYNGDTLVMTHIDAYFNCGFLLQMRFEMAGDTLRFYELNMSPDLMFCMCYYDISAGVSGIDPGEYVAEVYAADAYLYGGTIELVDRRTIQLSD